MTIYLDNDFKCHLTDNGTMLAYETNAFDGKCAAYIEGFRIVPEGYTWTREDGKVFGGSYTMITPWKDMDTLETAQQAYEQAQMEAMAAYEEGVNRAYEQ